MLAAAERPLAASARAHVRFSLGASARPCLARVGVVCGPVNSTAHAFSLPHSEKAYSRPYPPGDDWNVWCRRRPARPRAKDVQWIRPSLPRKHVSPLLFLIMCAPLVSRENSQSIMSQVPDKLGGKFDAWKESKGRL